jgi:hypothetical protein
MSSIASVIEEFPPDLRIPVQHLYCAIREDLRVPCEDFTELKATLSTPTDAQKRAESRPNDLSVTVTAGFKSMPEAIATLGVQ